MKTIIRNTALLILAIISSQGTAQLNVTMCTGGSTVITAINNSSLSGATYSMNPGGISSSSGTFAVAPIVNTSYTLHVTGTNSNSAVVTTSSTVSVMVTGTSYQVSSPNAFTLGCAPFNSITIAINNANTFPVTGGPVSYTLLAPGSSTVLPVGPLSSASVYTISTPGTWSVVVKDNTSSCATWSTVSISTHTTPPVFGSISVPQQILTCSTPSMLMQVAPNPPIQHTWFFIGTPGVLFSDSIPVFTNSVVATLSVVNIYTLVATDLNNNCKSYSVIPIYQNLYTPNAFIAGSNSVCASTLVLTNQSTTGIPIGPFPVSAPVVGWLWEGPAPQQSIALSSTYTTHTSGIHTLTAKDMNNGCTATATINVTVGPTAAFAHTLTGGLAIFGDISTNTSTNTTYFWNFGDGSTSTLQNATHTYLNGGAHLVKLKIANVGTFCVDSLIQSVNVSGVACSANSNFSMVPTSTAQVWNVVPSYPWNVTAASWSWGDGSYSNTLYTSHQYSAAGMYIICLSVTVSCSDTSSTCTTYSVYRTSQEAMILQVNVVAPALISSFATVKYEGQLSWNIAPNPNAGEFKLNLNTNDPGSARIVISDVTGRIVHDQRVEPGSDSISIQASMLPPGMYMVTLETGNLKATKRMVVLH